MLAEQGISFEIVPGITSAISVPAYAGIPLTHRDFASTVAFITGHEDEGKAESTIRWDELATGPDTLVFLMGVKNLKTTKERLITGGRDPDTQACVIQWGTLPKQKVVTGKLREIDIVAKKAGIRPPAIILVGNVITSAVSYNGLSSDRSSVKKLPSPEHHTNHSGWAKCLRKQAPKSCIVPPSLLSP